MAKKTTVAVPPPPSRSRLVAPPPVTTMTPDNLSQQEKWTDLNFKVDATFHRQFKTTATIWGMSMKDLLEASFKFWVQHHGAMPPNAQEMFPKSADDLFKRD